MCKGKPFVSVFIGRIRHPMHGGGSRPNANTLGTRKVGSEMRWLVRLVCEIVRLLVLGTVRASLQVLGCGVRLLYWSVRTYGWGRVGSFLAALWGSLWIHQQAHRLSFTGQSLGSVSLATLVLWGGLLGGCSWLTRAWRRRMASPDLSALPIMLPETSSSALPAPRLDGRVQALSVPARVGGSPMWTRELSGTTTQTLPAPAHTGGGGPVWEDAVSLTRLRAAWQRILIRAGGPGSDGITVEDFSLDPEGRLRQLAAELQGGSYHPIPPRWVEIPKRDGGARSLGVLCVRDRIVQQALHQALIPLWDKQFAPCSYAYRPGRSAHQAVAAVEKDLAVGRVWATDGDIASFFDSVPHRQLFPLVEEWLANDSQVHRLVQTCVDAVSPEPGRGLAQGAPLSPLLANLYLHRFDTTLSQAGHHLVRYADDFLVLSATRQQAEAALHMAERLLRGLSLSLNPDKTRIVHRDEGFTFLGYTFTREGKRPSAEAVESLEARLAAAPEDDARRQILTGWQGYFGAPAASGPAQGSGVAARAVADEPQWSAPWQSEMQEREDASAASPEGAVTSAAYRERFLGCPYVFARHWQRDSRNGYAPVRRAVTDEELDSHLHGQVILGTYLLHPDGTTRALVLDIDGPTPDADGQRKAFNVAQRLVAALREDGLAPLWVDSGGKGYHLWFCFREPAPAKPLRAWAGRWLDRFRPLPEGVLVEVFPKQDGVAAGGLGSLIRLPLGQHPSTGRKSVLLTPEGQSAVDPWAVLGAAPWMDPESLLRAGNGTVARIPEPPEAIGRMIEGCSLLSSLIGKAARTRTLRHTERLALLYVLGHGGEAGRAYLHQIVALCSNYEPRITERWLHRVQGGRKPIRCATLKDWLKDDLPGVQCACALKGANRSPADLLGKSGSRAETRRRREPDSASAGSSDRDTQGWEDVAHDLFGTTEDTATTEGTEHTEESISHPESLALSAVSAFSAVR